MPRISVSVSDQQYADLTRVAALDQTSTAKVIRDCIRATLPQLVMVTEFIHDPRNSNTDVLAFADQMERALGMLEQGSAGIAAVRDADEAGPATRRYRRPSPPSSNTGAQS